MRDKLIVGVGTINNRYDRNDIVKKLCSVFGNKNIITQQVEKAKNLFVFFLQLNICKRIHFTKSLENFVCIKAIHIFKYNYICIHILK